MNDQLDAFLRYADAMAALVSAQRRPAYAETCPCGGSIEVGQDVSRAELTRSRQDFIGRHMGCTRTPGSSEVSS